MSTRTFKVSRHPLAPRLRCRLCDVAWGVLIGLVLMAALVGMGLEC